MTVWGGATRAPARSVPATVPTLSLRPRDPPA